MKLKEKLCKKCGKELAYYMLLEDINCTYCPYCGHKIERNYRSKKNRFYARRLNKKEMIEKEIKKSFVNKIELERQQQLQYHNAQCVE